MQTSPDLNLLVALEAFLEERSVTGAARRLNLSVPATSRVLARIRREFDDPMMVRSGGRLVPTERALSLRERVHRLIVEAQALRSPTASIDEIDTGSLSRTFAVVAGGEVLMFLGGGLISYLQEIAPRVRCAFLPDPGNGAFGDSHADLIVGVIRRSEPQVRVEVLYTDRMVGVVRAGHRLRGIDTTLNDFMHAEHLVHSRQGDLRSRLGGGLQLDRKIVASAPSGLSFGLVAQTDLVGLCLKLTSSWAVRRFGLETFELPFEVEPVTIVQAWPPQFDRDPEHLWLRGCVRLVAERLVSETKALEELCNKFPDTLP
jgi:DNA-binding transcriptional LysR family regulator